MSSLILALCTIVLLGVLTMFLVRRFGLLPGLAVVSSLVVWFCMTLYSARNPGNAAIQPEIFGGETIAYSQRLGLRDGFWALFVIAPATLWAAVAVLIGRALSRRRVNA